MTHFRSQVKEYSEPYGGTTANLLNHGLTEVITKVGQGSLVFTEDTSLRINALSTDGDIPGLAVKEWFSTFNHTRLQMDIKMAGGDDGVIAKSDIALYIPGLGRPVYLHAETRGRVSPVQPNSEENPLYPWLTPNTFNGWFIPEESTTALGAMTVEESWQYDFRIRAFEALIRTLEEYSSVLNLQGSAYTTRGSIGPSRQRPLFSPRSPLFVSG